MVSYVTLTALAVYGNGASRSLVSRAPQGVTSTRSGGPGDPSLGARGSVWTVDARSGHARRLAGGFLGATNVALAPHGRIFVAELFAGRVSVIDRRGRVRPYVELPNALSLSWGKGVLYAGTLAPTDDEGNFTGTGSLVAIRTSNDVAQDSVASSEESL